MSKFPIKIMGLALTGFLVASYPVKAQFFYPPASMFSPTANTFRGLNLDPMEWLQDNDAGMLAFLLAINNLDGRLIDSKEPLTIFVPTNEAFRRLSREELKKLAKQDNIQKLLKYHMLEGVITEENIQNQQITTSEGSPIEIRGRQRSNKTTEIRLNNAKVDNIISLNNQLVFVVVDRVLLPQDF